MLKVGSSRAATGVKVSVAVIADDRTTWSALQVKGPPGLRPDRPRPGVRCFGVCRPDGSVRSLALAPRPPAVSPALGASFLGAGPLGPRPGQGPPGLRPDRPRPGVRCFGVCRPDGSVRSLALAP